MHKFSFIWGFLNLKQGWNDTGSKIYIYPLWLLILGDWKKKTFPKSLSSNQNKVAADTMDKNKAFKKKVVWSDETMIKLFGHNYQRYTVPSIVVVASCFGPVLLWVKVVRIMKSLKLLETWRQLCVPTEQWPLLYCFRELWTFKGIPSP